MSSRSWIVLGLVFAGVTSASWGGALRPCAAAERTVGVYRQALPDITLRNPLTGESVRLRELGRRRPAIIFVTTRAQNEACPLAQALAERRSDYAPWFSWTGVMSGPCPPEELARLHDSSPLRFQNCLHDPEGLLARELGLESLPALVLANERGYVYAVCSAGDVAAEAREIEGMLKALAAGSRATSGPLTDFHLPRVGSEKLASYLEVAGRDHTIISFLHSGCVPCAEQLEVLEYLRDRNADGVKLVTIFLDEAQDERILGYLQAAAVHPDAVLRDPRLHLAERYRIEAVPAVLVVDAAGRIVYSARGFAEEERQALYQEISKTFGAAAAGAPAPLATDPQGIGVDAEAYLQEGKPEFALLYLERLRELLPTCHTLHLLIAEAALAAGRRELAVRSYARYLAADPLAYDRAEIRARLAELLTAADDEGKEPPP